MLKCKVGNTRVSPAATGSGSRTTSQPGAARRKSRAKRPARGLLASEDRLALELRSGESRVFQLRASQTAVQERFARDFRRAAPGWDVVREPRAGSCG